jgi:hypothetical protein
VEVVLVEDHALPAVGVISSVHVGQRNDPPGYAELAHYVEHLTFRSSPPFTPVDELYERLGAVQSNAVTTFDSTDYFAVVPSTRVEQAIWLEARRLAIGLDTVTPAAALEERRVTQREFTLSHEVSPEQREWAAIAESLLPAGHPYRWPAATSSGDELSLANARWFFAHYYRPDNVRVVLVGDFETASVKALLEHTFGALTNRAALSLPKTSQTECRWADGPASRTHSRIIVRVPRRSERLSFIWALAPGENAERWRPSLETFRDIVRDAMRQVGLASSVTVSLSRAELASFWRFDIEVTPGRKLSEAESLARRLFANMIQRPQDTEDSVAQRQAIATTERLRNKTLLSRAFSLAFRVCQPVQCSTPPVVSLSELWRFAPSDALVVEKRYSAYADPQGDIEVVP